MIRSLSFGRVKPTFIIIGVQKAGTSSLYKYLIQHPLIIAPKQKELHYFDSENSIKTNKYIELFPRNYFKKRISFEATPRYIYNPGTAKKIHEFNPKIKLIVLLRNPVNRAYSAWNMYKQMALDPKLVAHFKSNEEQSSTDKSYSWFFKNKFPSFNEIVTAELNSNEFDNLIEPSIVRRGYYEDQIKEYFKYFNKSQFLFVDFNDLKENTLSVLNSVSSFLNISNFDNIKLNLEIENKRTYNEKINPDLYNLLLKHYQEKNHGLQELIDLKIDWIKS